MGTGSLPGLKRPRRGVDHAPPSSAEVKERVKLHSYSALGLRGLFWGELYFYYYYYYHYYKPRCALYAVETVFTLVLSDNFSS